MGDFPFPLDLPGHALGGAGCVPAFPLLPGGQTPRPPGQRFPLIRQFAFCLCHPKNQAQPKPSTSFGGWMAETCHCLFLQLPAQEWDAESMAPAVSSLPGYQGQLHPWVRSGPQGWTTDSGARSPSPSAPCPQPLGRLRMQPRLLAMGFAPVALLPSRSPLRNQ